MFPKPNRGINGVVLVFFVLILVIAAAIVMFSFTRPQANAVPVSSELPTPASAPGAETGLAAPSESNVPVEDAKQCTESCDDGDACTKDVCNAVFGLCDNQPISGCCGNKVCDGTETCLSSDSGANNSKACLADCGACVGFVNTVPLDWCVSKALSSSLIPPYIQIKQSLSSGKATLAATVLNPSEFTAKDVKVSIYPSAGFDLSSGAADVTIGELLKYDAKDLNWSFNKQTNAVLGVSNPTYVKLTYSLDNKPAVVCSTVAFGE